VVRVHPDGSKPQPDVSRFVDVWNHQLWHRYMTNLLPRFRHVRFVGYPSLKDVQNTRIERLYVPLNLGPRPVTPDQAEEAERHGIQELLDEHGRLVVLGDPGSGKSTLIAHLTTLLALQRSSLVIPLPVTLRDYRIGKHVTFDDLLDQFCRQPFWPEGLTREDLTGVLNSGQALILFDGLDEIGSVDVRNRLREQFWTACTTYPDCRWVLTSRIVGYDAVPFDRFATEDVAAGALGMHDDGDFIDLLGEMPKEVRRKIPRQQHLATTVYIVPFTDAQIDQFGRNWFAEREDDDDQAQTAAEEFAAAIRKHPTTHRLARTPNLLTMMALIYRVRTRLPNGRTLLYDEIAEAYLQTIQAQRKLELPPAPLDSMRSWLGYVAFQMQLQRQATEDDDDDGREVLANEDQVRTWIAEAIDNSSQTPDPTLPARFVDYLARRSGLLLPRGLDDAGAPLFAFMHLSFQEYFAAWHIRDVITAPRWLMRGSPRSPTGSDELAAWADSDRWRETLFFLAEMLASKSDWPDELATILFGEDVTLLSNAAEAASDTRAELAAALAVDPYSGLTTSLRQKLVESCCRWEVARQAADPESDRPPVVIDALLSADGEQLATAWRVFLDEARDASLQSLDLNQTSVSDLSGLSGLSSLRILNLTQTSVSDLSGLSGLSSLQYLDLTQTSVSDLSGLSGLSSLQSLDLNQTSVSDLSGLSGLSSLRILHLNQTSVSDLSGLSGLSSLQYLDLTQTSVSDLSGLSGLSSLRILHLNQTSVSDLSGLSGLSSLQYLNLNQTSVSDVRGLSGLSSLRILNLNQTSVSDLSGLSGLSSLRYLHLNQTSVSDLSGLSGLSSLRYLHLNQTSVSDDAVAAFNAARERQGLNSVHIVR